MSLIACHQRSRNERYRRKCVRRQKIASEIFRTAVDIQGLFAPGAGRAPSAAGQPEQVPRKSIKTDFKNFFEVQLIVCSSSLLMGFPFRKRRRVKKQRRFRLRTVKRAG